MESGENKINDPNLAEYYDKLHLIIRGGLWTGQKMGRDLENEYGAVQLSAQLVSNDSEITFK